MSAGAAMTALARGERIGHALLGACRFEWAGSETIGEEAIVEAFAASPLDLGEATLVETAAGCALVGADAALVADLYDGRIGRLWRLGPGEPPAAEPFVAVAFDPDLRQERGHVYCDPADHPELVAGEVERVIAAGHALLTQPGAPLHRARAFAARAFSAGDRTAALFAVHHLSARPVRQAGFGYAMALIERGETLLVRDIRPQRDWTPRL